MEATSTRITNSPPDCPSGIHGDRILPPAFHPIGQARLNDLVNHCEVAAERSLNPLFRRAYKHLADSANYVRLLEAEDAKPCCG